MSQQKALFIVSKQGLWGIDDRPIPKPGKGEVLVKIHATALNPADWKIQKYGLFPLEYPLVMGSDSSGEVAEVGEGVINFVKGDRVVHQGLFSDNDRATFQHYAICPAEILSKIPDTFTFDEAATIPLGLATAVIGYYNPVTAGGLGLTPFWLPEGRGKYKDQPIVVFGGSSSVGQFAIQAAKLSGFNPIITTSSLKHADYLKGLGATYVIDRSKTTIVEDIKSKLPDGKCNIVYDAISLESTQKVALELLGPEGMLLLTMPKSANLDYGNRTVSNVFGNVHSEAQRKLGVSLYGALPELLEGGEIKPNRYEVLKGGLSGIPEGLERMAADKVSGVKLIAHPWD